MSDKKPQKWQSQSIGRIVDGFVVSLDYDGVRDTLTIEVSHPNKVSMLRKAYKQEDSKAIKDISDNYLQEPYEVYEILRDALVGGDDRKGSITVDYAGKALHYKCLPFLKLLSMTFLLEKRGLAQDETYELVVKKMKSIAITAMTPSFQTTNRPNFIFTNGGKTLTKKGPDGWDGAIAQEGFFPTGRQRFSVRILNTVSRNVRIGVTLKTNDQNGGSFGKNTSYMFNCVQGNMIHGGGEKGYYANGVVIQKDDIISVVVDMDKKMVFIELNGMALRPATRMPNVATEQLPWLRPAVDLHAANDSVTFEW